MFGRKFCFTAVSQRAGFAGLHHFDQQFFVKPQCTGSLSQPGLLQIHLSDQVQSTGFVKQPDDTGASTDGSDDTRQEFLKENRCRKFLTGHLFDLACQLHHAFADFFQIFVRWNRFCHEIVRCTSKCC